jgi:glycosyltransferase involved in cell wall biosynthesis
MRIALLHYSGPPTIGGVEQTIYYQAKTLGDLDHEATFIVGKGDAVLPHTNLIHIPRLFSRHPDVLAAKRELDAGETGVGYQQLHQALLQDLSNILEPFQALIVHNALTLHKNLALTDVLWYLHQQGKLPPLIGWHHDFAWARPDYSQELHQGHPWDLLKQPWPGVVNVAVSSAQQESLAKLYNIDASKIEVIPPGIDPAITGRWTALTQELVDNLKLLEAEALFLLPARITRRKNIEFALEILAEVRKLAKKDIRLLITGPPGPHNPTNLAYLELLLRLVTELHLQDAVHFLYQYGSSPPLIVDDETMANLYNLCDALLFPSKDEGFGIPILEAGFTRMPVFCSDLHPFRESGQSQIYTFKLTESKHEIATRITDTLFKDRAFILGKRVRHDYTWQNIVHSKLIPILERLVHV